MRFDCDDLRSVRQGGIIKALCHAVDVGPRLFVIEAGLDDAWGKGSACGLALAYLLGSLQRQRYVLAATSNGSQLKQRESGEHASTVGRTWPRKSRVLVNKSKPPLMFGIAEQTVRNSATPQLRHFWSWIRSRFFMQNTVGTFVGSPVQKTGYLWVVPTILALPEVPVNY
jgi:hypothetical protein